VRPITPEEIKNVVFKMDPDKAPGPDGFNASFFQKYWDIVGKDTTKAVMNFFDKGQLLRQVNHTFLTLVPKVTNSSKLADFRPISCCNTLYKIISKVMCNRLQDVTKDLVSANQSAFLRGRQISDCSLLAHELVRDFNKWNGMLLKVVVSK